MSVKRKSDSTEHVASIKKQPKIAKIKSEKASNKSLQSNKPDDANAKTKKARKHKPNESKDNSIEKQEVKNDNSPNELKKTKDSNDHDKQEFDDNKENSNNEKSAQKKESALERREKKKKLKSERQSKKKKDETVVDLGTKAKHVWNKVRGDDCPENERDGLLNELHSLVKGSLNKVNQY